MRTNLFLQHLMALNLAVLTWAQFQFDYLQNTCGATLKKMVLQNNSFTAGHITKTTIFSKQRPFITISKLLKITRIHQ